MLGAGGPAALREVACEELFIFLFIFFIFFVFPRRRPRGAPRGRLRPAGEINNNKINKIK
jgi:hypothetical protein